MLVSNGQGDDINDAICIMDANGFPTIPGTSIVGALRHAFAGLKKDKDLENEIFGIADGNDGSRSLITISWASAHDANDRPVSPRIQQDGNKQTDSVLEFLKSGVHRDHVRINERGVAANRGKFDERLVPRGARFTFSLLLNRDEQKKVALTEFIQILQEPSFRFGGKTRRGFGAFEVSKVQMRYFNLHEPKDFTDFAKYSFDLSKPCQFQVAKLSKPKNNAINKQTRTLSLMSKDFLLPSGGIGLEEIFKQDSRWEHADIFPVYEHEILWNNGKGSVSKEAHFFLPSTSIKGILRHRTLFYLRVLNQQFVPDDHEYILEKKSTGAAEDITNQLFGMADEGEQIPGAVLVSEPIFPSNTKYRVIQHVALDKFTNAPMSGALFGEVVLETSQTPIEINISVDWDMLKARENNLDEKIETLSLNKNELKLAAKALNLACQDIAKGRLTLGGGSSRGHGRVQNMTPFNEFTVAGE